MLTMILVKTMLMETLAMKCRLWRCNSVSTMMSLEGVPRGNDVSMPCRAGEVDEDLHLSSHPPGMWTVHVIVASHTCAR